MPKKKKKRWSGTYVVQQGRVGVAQASTLKAARTKLTKLKKTGQRGLKITQDYWIGKRRYTKVYPDKKTTRKR